MRDIILSIIVFHAAIFASAAFAKETSVSLKVRPNSWTFCPNGAEAFGHQPQKDIQNKEERSLSAVLSLSTDSIKIQYKSPDWASEASALNKVREVLGGKPGTLSSFPGWAEGVLFAKKNVIATFSHGGKMEIAGYHVCVLDSAGGFWYFRTVPVDGWKK